MAAAGMKINQTVMTLTELIYTCIEMVLKETIWSANIPYVQPSYKL